MIVHIRTTSFVQCLIVHIRTTCTGDGLKKKKLDGILHFLREKVYGNINQICFQGSCLSSSSSFYKYDDDSICTWTSKSFYMVLVQVRIYANEPLAQVRSSEKKKLIVQARNSRTIIYSYLYSNAQKRATSSMTHKYKTRSTVRKRY